MLIKCHVYMYIVFRLKFKFRYPILKSKRNKEKKNYQDSCI